MELRLTEEKRKHITENKELSILESQENQLQTLGVDLLKWQNARLHHTDAYDNKSLIVRRGQEFQLKLMFDRELKDNDRVGLQFSFGDKPMKSNGTLLAMTLRSQQDSQCWSAKIANTNGKECLVTVASPADAAIGKYLLSVKTGAKVYNPGNTVYLLFNPWCKADAVFMPSDAERLEYVLNDTGYLYVGSSEKIFAKPWNFGQFEEDVLDSCMYLLDKSGLKQNFRKDPVTVSRTMSALVNSNDDAGVLLGNWSGNYGSGTSPLAWTGSATILQKYYKTKKPICFGQCWVFSGVLTTVMRCLGIPARSVSNFASAHDTQENLKVDIFLNECGEKVDKLTTDSVWNFHVWNDVWMKRSDLPEGFDGWQAIDATPQEISQGIFQCGPSPLKAIRSGEVYLPYDSKFIFAEVNADKVYWLVKNVAGKDKYIKLREETKAIGKNISTKAIGKNMREDITAQYKFLEGSSEERKTMEKACSFLRCSDTVDARLSSSPLTAGIQLKTDGEKSLWPGNPIDLKIIVNSTSTESWTASLTASCQLQSYTGKVEANLGFIKQTVQTEGKPAIEIPLNVAADTYIKTLASVEDELLIKVNIIAEVQETGEKVSDELTLAFQYPSIKVEMPETAKINEAFTCAFVFKNTLAIPLEKCKLYVEGLGFFKMEIFDEGDIRPGGIFKSKIICHPKKAGEKKIIAQLNSLQVKGISVEKIIIITE
ncbi:protein-glutamine gamma-glutamyltransferase 4 [Alligator mississippiensis]|uniref:protein-glutamine gamma-glutamyltransferase 4 n=1 Tax=Alligator mississippiensis TaxID=8496 RepID=UPI0003D07EE8|nr:protein-glutamine gamma-glutamyltransferase 4 [Alligator mississippiensis]